MIITQSIILTLTLVVVHIFFKQTRKPLFYLVIFALMLLINFAFSKAEALPFNDSYENESILGFNSHAREDIFNNLHLLGYNAVLTRDEKRTYQEKIAFHQSNAERTLQDAKNKCWWIPNTDYREKAKYCFTAAVSAVSMGTPQSRIVAGISSMLICYGIDCQEEWHYIKNKLYWSEYHYEMMEFYQDVLRYG